MKIEGREKVGDGGEWLLVDSTAGNPLTRSWLLESREEAVIRRDLCLTDIAEMETTHMLTMFACASMVGLSIALMCGLPTVFDGWTKMLAAVLALFSSCSAFLLYFAEERDL